MNIKVENISQTFKNQDDANRTVLDGINFEVKAGEFLVLMGPSGCGKSTLLRIMAGLTPPSVGQILNRPNRIAFVFQNFGLMPWLTVEQNIAFGLKMADEGPNYTRQMVSKQMRQLGLSGLGSHHPKELSGGQKQRVGLARALAVNPDVLMLDEPFSALDAFTAAELRHDLLKLWQNNQRTIIMVTHLPSEAAELADRILVLSPRPGQIISEISNKLPRPRDTRSQQFYKLTDRLESLIRPS